MKKKLLKATGMLLMMMVVGSAWGQTNYYSAGNHDVTATANWWTNTDGTGSNPADFTSGDVFIIQNAHSMSTSTVWAVSGTGSKLWIENGGTLNATHAITLATSTLFQIDDGGTYKHDNTTAYGTTILRGIESFASSSNFEINLSSTTGPAGSTVFGNLIINYPSGTNINLNGAISTVNGNLIIQSTGTGEFRFSTNTSYTIYIGGDLIITGGTLNTSNGTNESLNYNINLAGNFNQTGGVFTHGNSNSPLVFNFTGVGKTFTSTGTITNNSINWDINSGASLTLNDDLSIATLRLVTINGTVGCGVSSVVSGLGSFTLSSSGIFITANTSGIDGSITVSGTKTFDNAANYEFNGSTTQVTGALLPAIVNNLTVDNLAGIKLSNSALTVNGNMTINNGKLFTLESGKNLTINGTLTNNAGTSGLVIQSDATGTGSLTHNTTGVIGTMQRYIPAYTTSADGWHLLSSPVNNMAIAGSDFEPGIVSPNLDDFYAFSESTYEWLNYKVGANNITNFVNGTGYLVSYETTSTKDFTGTLNAANVPFTNLSKTAGKGNGWHLLGNPFQSALQWTNTDWARTNIAAGAKIMNSGGTYTDITVGGTDIIPANQGFFVQATVDASNSITIPISQRVHDATLFYKSSILNQLALKVSDGEFYVETWIQMMEGATTDFDEQYDVNFLGGMYQAPYLYSIISGEGHLSTNRIAPVNEQTTVPLAFKAFLNREYTITASNASSFGDEIEVILEDTQENIQIDLKDTLEYTFMATADELTERFVVHFFNVTGISETPHSKNVQIYSYGNRIYLHSELNAFGDVTIFNLLGQNVYHTPVELNGLQSFSLNLNKGWYVVQVITKQGVKSKKVFIN